MAKEAVIEKMKHKMQPPPPKEVSISEATESMRKVLEKQVSEETMRKERYEHSVRVAAECKRLAQIYHVNEDLAEFAGMVHDICKDMKADDQKALMEAGKDDLDITEEEWNTKKLWHGIAGAQLMRQKYCMNNQHVLDAIRYHTVARKGMTPLEQIVYLADMTEAGRNFIDVHTLRAAVNQNLNLGMYYALKISIANVLDKGGLLPRHTIEAYNQYVQIVAGMKD